MAPRADRVSDQVAAELRRRIIVGEVADGDDLSPERDLLDEFGVSRPTLREAMRVLEAESLIDIPRSGVRRGARVRTPKIETSARYLAMVLQYRQVNVADVFAAACALEAPCAATLAQRRQRGDVEQLRITVDDEQQSSGDPVRLLELQNHFHRQIVELAGNETLLVVIDVLRSVIESATHKYLARAAESPEARNRASLKGIRAHARLVELIDAGKAEQAAELWRRQILATGEHIRESGVNVSIADLML